MSESTRHPEFGVGVFRSGEMLSLDAIAARLGLRSTRTLFDELRRREVPYERVCGKYLFDADTVRLTLFGGMHNA